MFTTKDTKSTKFGNNIISETFVFFVANPIFSFRLRLYRGTLRGEGEIH